MTTKTSFCSLKSGIKVIQSISNNYLVIFWCLYCFCWSFPKIIVILFFFWILKKMILANFFPLVTAPFTAAVRRPARRGPITYLRAAKYSVLPFYTARTNFRRLNLSLLYLTSTMLKAHPKSLFVMWLVNKTITEYRQLELRSYFNIANLNYNKLHSILNIKNHF